MKIQKEILGRIKRLIPMKINLHDRFYQNGYEYLTNSFYMIKMKATEKHEDTPEMPIMEIAEKSAMPKGKELTRVDIRYLMDTLQVLKDNGAVFVNIRKDPQAVFLSGLDGNTKEKLSAIIMGIHLSQ